jgi:hypothetical protein
VGLNDVFMLTYKHILSCIFAKELTNGKIYVMISNRRHNRLRPAGEFLLKTTMLATVAVSAWVGGYKLHEGLDRPAVTIGVQGFTDESVARAAQEIESNATDTFIDLALGAGGLGLSGLLVLGSVTRRLSMAKSPSQLEEEYAVESTPPSVQPSSPDVPFDPAAYGWLDSPVRVAAF